MNGRKELFRLANIALAITAPIFLIGAILLKNTDGAVQQGFAMFVFFLCAAIFFALDERNKRRRRRDQ